MNIGFDLDDVLYPFSHVAHTEMVIHWGADEPYETFFLDEGAHFKTRHWWDEFVKIPCLYSSGVPRKEDVQFLQTLAKKHTIYYITSRPPEVRCATLNWLKRYDFPMLQNLYFTSDKVEAIKQLNIDVYVEDRPKYFIPLSDVCSVFIVRQLWNEGKTCGLSVIDYVSDLEGVV